MADDWEQALGGPRTDAAEIASDRMAKRPEGMTPAYTSSRADALGRPRSRLWRLIRGRHR